MSSPIQVAQLVPDGQFNIITLSPCTVDQLQELVDGSFEWLGLQQYQDFHGMHAYVQEDALIVPKIPPVNFPFHEATGLLIRGNIVFSRVDENGDEIGITDHDCRCLQDMFCQ